MTNYELMFHKALIDLQSRFKSGAFDYARQKYPQYRETEAKLFNSLREVWKQPDAQVFREALKKWYSLMRKIMDEYRKEPNHEHLRNMQKETI